MPPPLSTNRVTSFFEDVDGEKQFREVWGGIALVSEHAEQVAWAEALGAPSDLAACFADATATEE
jgi:hypothetical protein